MSTPHREAVVLSENGKLVLENLPFHAGETVEVIMFQRVESKTTTEPPLRGMVLRFDEPTAPVAEADWSALQ